jgi:hypothetical protein
MRIPKSLTPRQWYDDEVVVNALFGPLFCTLKTIAYVQVARELLLRLRRMQQTYPSMFKLKPFSRAGAKALHNSKDDSKDDKDDSKDDS